jgi:tetratricopeptide (TPR) repeat protein
MPTKMLQITSKSSPKEISDYIAKLREQKGKEQEVLHLIEKSLSFGHDFVINLFWEKALTNQHLIMNEDAKGESANKKARSHNLLKMEQTVMNAKYYIVRFDLERWKHRLYRFMGRICDYQGDYKRAITYYKKSISYAKIDPEYLEYRYPRWLEVKGFLSFSLIMSGSTSRGYELAWKTFNNFDTDRDAIFLKENDYVTWAIWKSGIPVRTINAFLDKKVTFDRKDAVKWLLQVEALLRGDRNFKYRKNEVILLRKKLSSTN